MAQALGVPIRVLLAGGSRAALPAGLAKAEVIKLDSAKLESDVGRIAEHALEKSSISISTALEGLTQQYQRIEEEIQQVRTMLGGTYKRAAVRTTGAARGKGRKQSLSVAARKRVAAGQNDAGSTNGKRRAGV